MTLLLTVKLPNAAVNVKLPNTAVSVSMQHRIGSFITLSQAKLDA